MNLLHVMEGIRHEFYIRVRDIIGTRRQIRIYKRNEMIASIPVQPKKIF